MVLAGTWGPLRNCVGWLIWPDLARIVPVLCPLEVEIRTVPTSWYVILLVPTYPPNVFHVGNFVGIPRQNGFDPPLKPQA